MAGPVRVERDGAVALVTIDHPPANAISGAVVAGLRSGFDELVASNQVRAVVVTGAGARFFSAGADITEFAGGVSDAVAASQQLTLLMESLPLAIVAAVNGIAFGGGCELALACDIRLAATTARFGQPEINLGIIPGWGGTQRLPRLVGRGPALQMLLLGEPVDAETALRIGLVSQVVAPDALLDAAHALAERLAAQAPLAVAATKRAVAEGLDRPLEQALAVERREFVGIFGSDDAREGVTAFLEKRRPQWSGR